MSEPRTATGRSVLDLVRKTGWVTLSTDAMQGFILAIEAEAATPPASAMSASERLFTRGEGERLDDLRTGTPPESFTVDAATPPASAERDAVGAGAYRALVSKLVAQVAEYGFPVEGDSRYAKAIDSWCEKFARAAEARDRG